MPNINFNLIRISVTYLDSSFSVDDSRLNLQYHNLVRADNHNNIKRGSVSVYFEESLSVRSVTAPYFK